MLPKLLLILAFFAQIFQLSQGYAFEHSLFRRSSGKFTSGEDHKLTDLLDVHEYNFDTREAEMRKRGSSIQSSSGIMPGNGVATSYNQNVRAFRPIDDPERG